MRDECFVYFEPNEASEAKDEAEIIPGGTLSINDTDI